MGRIAWSPQYLLGYNSTYTCNWSPPFFFPINHDPPFSHSYARTHTHTYTHLYVSITCIAYLYCYVSSPVLVAGELLAEDANAMMAKYPDTLLFILGDFNNSRLDCVMPSLHQYMEIPTRKHNTLELCYGNIPDALVVQVYPPIAPSLTTLVLFCFRII